MSRGTDQMRLEAARRAGFESIEAFERAIAEAEIERAAYEWEMQEREYFALHPEEDEVQEVS